MKTVRVEAHDRKRLEQLCLYVTRPALPDDRVQVHPAGQVELKPKTRWRDGTTHRVMSPLEFMQRLAALVPLPRLHLRRVPVPQKIGEPAPDRPPAGLVYRSLNTTCICTVCIPVLSLSQASVRTALRVARR